MSISNVLSAEQRAGEEEEVEMRDLDNEVEELESEGEYESEPEKSGTEEELEKLVFGDSAGFRHSLKSSALNAVEEDADEQTGLEGLDDADVG